jgi:tRNA1(Val) A37 N6-methylase TrmN6
VLIERDPALAGLARRNAAETGFAPRVRVIEASIAMTAAEFAAHGLAPDSFDHVLANPPYYAHGRGIEAPDPLKAASHAMPEGDLESWIRFMARMTRPGGAATIVHTAGALGAILAAYDGRFGDIAVLPLYPRPDEPASRILVQGIKGSRAPLGVLPGVVLHGDGNSFTPAAQAILRDGAGVVMR